MAVTRTLDNIGAFSPDADRSLTLPGRYYFDAGIFEQEKHAIFYRTWHYAGHVCSLRKPGDYIVRELFEQSVIILRAPDGELKAFHNVCQHRAHRLLEGEGRVENSIVCPYHSWTYGLGGELLRARGSEGVANFDRGLICLSAVRVEVLCGFVFFNLCMDAPSLADQTQGLEEEIRYFSPEPERLTLAYRREYALEANWKNVVENFSECYHCVNRHPSLAASCMDIGSYRVKVHAGYHSHHSHDKGDEVSYALDAARSEHPNEYGGWLIWPNLSPEVFPGGNFNILHHVPVAPERTLQIIEWYFPSEELGAAEREIIDFMHVVREEDIPICEQVQRGLHSMGYQQGRFMIDEQRSEISEHAVHDFQAKVVEALASSL